jgi:hypothetical protein
LILDLTIFVKDSSSKINNIRVISRIINALNDFSFIESGIKDVPEVTTEIVGNIIEIAAINAQTSSFLELREYANKRILPDASDKLKKNKKYEDKIITTLQFFCSFSSDISPRTSFNSIDDDSLSKSSKHTIISLKSCLSSKVIPMPI